MYTAILITHDHLQEIPKTPISLSSLFQILHLFRNLAGSRLLILHTFSIFHASFLSYQAHDVSDCFHGLRRVVFLCPPTLRGIVSDTSFANLKAHNSLHIGQ